MAASYASQKNPHNFYENATEWQAMQVTVFTVEKFVRLSNILGRIYSEGPFQFWNTQYFLRHTFFFLFQKHRHPPEPNPTYPPPERPRFHSSLLNRCCNAKLTTSPIISCPSSIPRIPPSRLGTSNPVPPSPAALGSRPLSPLSYTPLPLPSGSVQSKTPTLSSHYLSKSRIFLYFFRVSDIVRRIADN